MDKITLFRQFLLFIHILFFAVAIAEILKEDWRLLRAARMNRAAMIRTEATVLWSLLGLWASGLSLIYLDVGLNIDALLGKPKLVTKLIVVSVLTLNGLLLHALAFPMLLKQRKMPVESAAYTIAALGAVSTASWLYASFVGVSRLIAPAMTLHSFIGIYLLSLSVALAVATLFLRHRLERLLQPSRKTISVRKTGRHAV